MNLHCRTGKLIYPNQPTWFESTLSQFHCTSFIWHEEEDFAGTHILVFLQQSGFAFSNKDLFWDFSRVVLICSLQFFFHIYGRLRNSIGVRVPMVLVFWKYCRIYLPSICHVIPTPSASLASCSNEFHCLTLQSKEDFHFLWWDFVTWNPTFLWGAKRGSWHLSLAPQWFYSVFPHPFLTLFFPWGHFIPLIILPALFCTASSFIIICWE